MCSIIASDIEMRFGERLLFTAEHLRFRQQDVIYLQGDNGSGKTTLMKLLAGLLRPSRGYIVANGFAKTSWWRKDSLLGKALYLHQHPYLFEGNVGYNLQLAQRYSRLSVVERRQRMTSAIELAKLDKLLKANAATLSGGERQRLALARVWLLKPSLLMLDEPISNMDRVSQQLVCQMISELKQQHTGLLISSHQDSELIQLCNERWQIKSQQITTSQLYPGTQAELNRHHVAAD
ncbi:energy-coupling factor ABC transporter ATP-binding protein [Shewanella dokdonensis]|uniref:Energy-coupling factor ABC transporter ATP-binding protein n=1 Tax=Shewanella dokdonensis TaxID=712036 RepID=A0ABX8DIJ9_9GAMM|nr:energy-coupling factor ABC transporter ATP-binding protein [Shewanella dokdonensis]MCL1075616.1 energy-coupling factor ABC transporter ATP-binding protein [Shewanella dokdonensis]QVK24619.1 energy-coupling factor ABC transporter ATP-binding protein [Shewanella dokdonensis]